jgi:cation:H+ antiporter
MELSVLGFIVCAGVILWSGKKLSYYGDLIADLTGMGKVWLGMVLMASITSLPELIVGVSSSAFIGSADLAVGDILGSCAINLGILAMMDALVPRTSTLFRQASQNHILAAAFGIILVALAGFGLFLSEDFPVIPGIGLVSLLFALIYFLSMRVMYRFGQSHPQSESAQGGEIVLTKRQVYLRYAMFAGIIVVAAMMLPHFAEEISAATGLGQSFVGTLFLAASTSLPEVAVSMAAVRMGSIDIAVGNLLGSNIFNIFILFLDDIAYTKGQLLQDASDVHLVSVFGVLMMSSVAIIGLMYRASQKRFLLAWDSLAIFLIYIANLVVLYKLS